MSSVLAGAIWKYDDLTFQGLSLSGIRTSIAMPDLNIAFDVAQGYPNLLSVKKFFLSHGHLDHAAGVPYLISQKILFHHSTPEFYMPPTLVNPLAEIMKIWEKIENHNYICDFRAVDERDIPVNNNHFVRAFPTVHRIESFGYTLFKMHKHLKAKWQGASQKDIIEAKEQGENVDETSSTPLVTFSGDTQIEFLLSRDWIRKSKVLFLEATYLDSKKTVQQARDWGHTHLDEIIPLLDEIESEKIVLIHISSRYSMAEAERIVRDRIPKRHSERVDIFPGR